MCYIVETNNFEVSNKYTPEEKAVEIRDEEDNKTSVAQRLQQIENRLTAVIPASSQRVEIAQEITSLRNRTSIDESEPDNSKLGNNIKALKTNFELINIKTTTTSETVGSKIVSNDVVCDNVNILHQGENEYIERSKNNEKQQYKISKTPPPSPAHFFIKQPIATDQGK